MNQYTVRLNEKRIPELKKVGEIICKKSRCYNAEIIAGMMENAFSLSDYAEEYVYMLALDTAMHPLGIFELSHGTVNASLIGTRELFIRALLCGAVGFVLIHNHPSMDVTPSIEDRKIAEKVMQSGKLLGVQELDFIIIGNGFLSFKEEGLL